MWKGDDDQTNHEGVSTGKTHRVSDGYSSELTSPLYAILRFLLVPEEVWNNDFKTLHVLSPITSLGWVPGAGVHKLYPRSIKQLLLCRMGWGQSVQPLVSAHLKNLTQITFCCASDCTMVEAMLLLSFNRYFWTLVPSLPPIGTGQRLLINNVKPMYSSRSEIWPVDTEGHSSIPAQLTTRDKNSSPNLNGIWGISRRNGSHNRGLGFRFVKISPSESVVDSSGSFLVRSSNETCACSKTRSHSCIVMVFSKIIALYLFCIAGKTSDHPLTAFLAKMSTKLFALASHNSCSSCRSLRLQCAFVLTIWIQPLGRAFTWCQILSHISLWSVILGYLPLLWASSKSSNCVTTAWQSENTMGREMHCNVKKIAKASPR